jgi:ketosteroid isomerase-like protein
MATPREIAAALHTALETGQVDGLAPLLADDAVVWHNSDRLALTKGQALPRIGGAANMADAVHVEVVSRQETADGFLEQIVLRGTVRSTGSPLELHNCLVVSLRNGLVTRIDEYVDPNVTAQIKPERQGGHDSPR